MIDELRDHIIVCGYGRVGRRAAEEFRAAGAAYVVLDFSEQALASAEQNGDLWVDGNGAEDDDLTRAGIDRAAGPDRRLGRRRRQPLHHPLREGAPARPRRDRARVDARRPSGS